MDPESSKRKAEDVQLKQDEEYERMLEEAATKLKKRRKTDESVKAYLDSNHCDEEKAIRLGYKSRLCQFFEKGTCHKGLLCQYAHGKSDLIQMKPTAEGVDISAAQQASARAASQQASASAAGFAGGLGGAMDSGLYTFAAPGMSLGPVAGSSGSTGFPASGLVSSVPRGPKPMRCALFPRGMCRLGEICPWAHSPEELMLARNMGNAGAVASQASSSRSSALPPMATGMAPMSMGSDILAAGTGMMPMTAPWGTMPGAAGNSTVMMNMQPPLPI